MCPLQFCSRGFFPRTTGAERIRGYESRICKDGLKQNEPCRNLEYLWYRLLIHWYGVVKRPLPLWLRNFQLLEVNRHAKKQYKPEIYPGELTIFRQVEETEEYIAPDMGWSKLTSSAIHVHNIPGGHLSLLQEPHVQELAELLQASLDASSVKK